MKSSTIRVMVLSVLVLGGGTAVLFADLHPDDPRVKVRAAIEDLSNHLTDKGAPERAKKIVAEYDSCDISTFFQGKRHGGFGIGTLAKNQYQDSVQFLVAQLNRRKDVTETELGDNQADYLRVAKGLQAMAQLAPHRGKPFTRGDVKKEQAWAAVSTDFQKNTADFRTAVEERDPKKVRLAAVALHHTCCNCHVLRD